MMCDRLTLKEAKSLGLTAAEIQELHIEEGSAANRNGNSANDSSSSNSSGDLAGGNNENDDNGIIHEDKSQEQEDMMNDLNGIHFLDFVPLFVAYLYIYSGTYMES